jgi:hypothetical protein
MQPYHLAFILNPSKQTQIILFVILLYIMTFFLINLLHKLFYKKINQKISSSDKTGGAIGVFFLVLRFVFSVTVNTSFINLVFLVRLRFFGGIGVLSSSDRFNSVSFSFAS